MKKILTVFFSMLISSNLYASSFNFQDVLNYTIDTQGCPSQVRDLSSKDMATCLTKLSSKDSDQIRGALCILAAREQLCLEPLADTTKALIHDRALSSNAYPFDQFIYAISLHNQQKEQEALIFFLKASKYHATSRDWVQQLRMKTTSQVSPLYTVAADMQNADLQKNHLSSAMGVTQILTCLGSISHEPLPMHIKEYLKDQTPLDVNAAQLQEVGAAYMLF